MNRKKGGAQQGKEKSGEGRRLEKQEDKTVLGGERVKEE